MTTDAEKALNTGDGVLVDTLLAEGMIKNIKVNNSFDKEGTSTAVLNIVVDIPYRENTAVDAAKLAGEEFLMLNLAAPEVPTYYQPGIMKNFSVTNTVDRDGEVTPALRIVLEAKFDHERAVDALGLIGADDRVKIKITTVQMKLHQD
jgi:hypothetical protein